MGEIEEILHDPEARRPHLHRAAFDQPSIRLAGFRNIEDVANVVQR
jgi:hypothetical protein